MEVVYLVAVFAVFVAVIVIANRLADAVAQSKCECEPGISQRERIAMVAMEALLEDGSASYLGSEDHDNEIARRSVAIADAVIARLGGPRIC